MASQPGLTMTGFMGKPIQIKAFVDPDIVEYLNMSKKHRKAQFLLSRSAATQSVAHMRKLLETKVPALLNQPYKLRFAVPGLSVADHYLLSDDFPPLGSGSGSAATAGSSGHAGGIARLTELLYKENASIKDIYHERAWLHSNVDQVAVKCVVELQGKEHAARLRTALKDAGYPLLWKTIDEEKP
jgi:hypothetical protein